MTRTLLAVLALAAAAAIPTAASAQVSTGFTLSAGMAMPSGDFKNGSADVGAVDNGYNVAAGLHLGVPLLPVGVRIEGAYNGFSARNLPSGATGSENIMSATVNGTVGMGLPYLIGGIGYYSAKAKGTVAGTTYTSDRANAMGLNGGVGLRFPLGVISTYAEIRYHKMMGSSNATSDNLPAANVSYIPITFGINF